MNKLTYLSLLLLFFNGMPSISQTLEIEYDSMMNKYLSKEIGQLEFKDLTFAWRALIDSVGYPEIPYDSVSKKVEYTFFSSLESVPRETIVNRVSEWAAVSFGSINSLLTHQGETSRLILNGSIEVFFPDLFMVYKNAWRGYVEKEMQNSSICYFTFVFTIREDKMKTQILNLSYEYTDYVSERTVSTTLDSFFPISSNEKDEWKAIIGLINDTERSLQAMIKILEGYILAYERDYLL